MHITIYIRQVLTVLFFSCTTCIVYQYFKELAAFVLKAGAKVRGFILTTKCFRKFFFRFSFSIVSQTLLAKGKEGMKEELRPFFFANRTAKIRTLFIIIQTFSEVFLVFLFTRFLWLSMRKGKKV